MRRKLIKVFCFFSSEKKTLSLILLGALLWAAVATAAEAPKNELPGQAAAQSVGCISCHTASDAATMHSNKAVVLGCADCHGGDPAVLRPAGSGMSFGPPRGAVDGLAGHAPAVDRRYDPAYLAAMDAAHVKPRHPEVWNSPASAKPERSYTALNQESPEFIQFLNPADYRVDRHACGACHQAEVQENERSLMSTGAMLWGGAAYNNGILPEKHYITGEAYTEKGQAAKISSAVMPDAAMMKKGMLPQLTALPPWEVTPPKDIFRIFERGGRIILSQFPDIGNPNSSGEIQKLDEPGRPDFHASNRGPGTGGRIAVPLINITKTRLNDPTMWFLGTNDQPGDYRSSGCAGCHVVYSNDRDVLHSGPYAAFGHDGASHSVDPTIPRGESGHPLQHVFTRAVPTSQCMVCHMHQPNVFVNSFMGYTMWDYESDAPAMWPTQQQYPSAEKIRAVNERNPEGAAARGKWADVEFLARVADLNPGLHNTQFADYHGHGWNFRAVYKQDRKGHLLDAKGDIVSHQDPDKFKKAVHLVSIHMEKGMQCVDCHFAQDMHGNGMLYGEVSAAIEIQCVDCHGTVDKRPTLRTSGPAAPPGGHDLSTLRNQDGSLRFEWRDGELIQRSAVTPGMQWRVSLVKDSVDPASVHYNPRAARAKLMSDGWSQAWGPGVLASGRLAHPNSQMMCITCHTSWTTSCSGCHLPIEANWKTPRQHFEGGETRNFATYNPQVARDDMFFLGRNSTPKGNVIAPIRSSSALVLSSTNINRERVYIQQPPIAASGFSSQAFAPHYPHTERTVETKACEDCHVSKADDNNAIMAQLLLLGTDFVNFIGYNAWLGEASGVEAVQVTEWEEPQAVIGSYLHRYAYPDYFRAHQARGQELQASFHHAGDETRCVQLRGEYLYTAAGSDGFRVYDVAAIANKGVSDRILTGPVSPLGQNTHVSTTDATCVALPTNQPIAPGRNMGQAMRDNEEQVMHPLYHYAFITDSHEGLIAVNVDTLADGEPRNNFLHRAMTWNDGGILNGARHITIAGTVFYIVADVGIVVLDMNDPLHPYVLSVIGIKQARATALQFRYLFVADARGLSVVDVTHPQQPQIVPGAEVGLRDARHVYVARTFAYVADGPDGLAIIDVERPRAPRLAQIFNAGGRIKDATDVVVGTTNASLFAYVADGAAGLKVVQLTSPATQPGFYGFSPDPVPELIAWRMTAAAALAVSKGLDRDRAVDETGNQIAVFGRVGSRPFTLAEMQKLYLDGEGRLQTVSNAPEGGAFTPVARGAPAVAGPLFRKPGG